MEDLIKFSVACASSVGSGFCVPDWGGGGVAYMEENECYLCEETLARDKRKRKRFYGSSCENFKNNLQKLSVPLSEVIQEVVNLN